MKNKLIDLNNHLFAQLERLGDEELSQDDVEKEIKRAGAIVSVSEQIIDNAQINLEAARLMAKHGAGNFEKLLPAVEGKPQIPNYKKESCE